MIIKRFNNHRVNAVLFSWLYTGLGQFYNGHYFKGLLFLIINTLNNHFGHLNVVLLHSFLEGEFYSPVKILDFQWILNYPSFFAFAQWDAYKHGYIRDQMRNPPPIRSFPFILAGGLSTIGIIYGARISDPFLFGLAGFLLGLIFGFILTRKIDHGYSAE